VSHRERNFEGATIAPLVPAMSLIGRPASALASVEDGLVPLPISEREFSRLIGAARDRSPVSGYTHNFYKYPARFSPKFVRAAIEIFTRPGDLVFDPFVGGGTSLVEAMVLGRSALGTDISALAAFVATAKTTLYDEIELARLARWTKRLEQKINMDRQAVHFDDYAELGYYRHLDTSKTWRLRKAIEQAIGTAIQLHDSKLEIFARCAVLRASQWALDARKKLPRVDEFRSGLTDYAGQMINGARELREAVARHARGPRIDCLHRPVAGVETDPQVIARPRPRLVLTSPPYPGIHMLYHRWQVDGRKESSAPFWIANKLDGAGSSYYTMGDRKAEELWTYFAQLETALRSIAALCDEATTIIQVVAFAEPEWQLPRYLDVARSAGMIELQPPAHDGSRDGRLWRQVPNRRWHADQRGEIPACNGLRTISSTNFSNVSETSGLSESSLFRRAIAICSSSVWSFSFSSISLSSRNFRSPCRRFSRFGMNSFSCPRTLMALQSTNTSNEFQR
jgi:DNA modification methylase